MMLDGIRPKNAPLLLERRRFRWGPYGFNDIPSPMTHGPPPLNAIAESRLAGQYKPQDMLKYLFQMYVI